VKREPLCALEEGTVARLRVLSVGENVSLGFARARICYAGMPNDQTYSIGLRKWDFVHMVYGWNLYFPKDQAEINIDGVDIRAEEVTPTEIRLSWS
jgi:hypothetical protein